MKSKLCVLLLAGAASLTLSLDANAYGVASTGALMSVVTASSTSYRSNQDDEDNALRQQQQATEENPKIIDWKERGWLYCPRRDSEPQGCKDDKENIVPWVDWMKISKGEDARMLNLIINSNGSVIVSYGITE